jgi:hypothetical protein
MQPTYVFSTEQRNEIANFISRIDGHPYEDYPSYSASVAALVESEELPGYLREIADGVRGEWERGGSSVHVLRNCPIDASLPDLDHADPVADKRAKKKTFVAEGFLAIYAKLLRTPLLAYGSRNGGDFFTDVVAIERYSGMQTGFSDSELVYHNDRTAHAVRADFVTLLGLRCPNEDLIYTGFIDGRHLLEHLSPPEQEILRKPYFFTPFDVYSRATNSRQIVSDTHPILENHHSFRYLDTFTTVLPDSPPAAKDALLALKNAMVKAERVRHRLLTGDMLLFANQDGLHNREKVDVTDPESARTRWLLKTYTFRDQAAAERHAHRWLDGIQGRIAD